MTTFRSRAFWKFFDSLSSLTTVPTYIAGVQESIWVVAAQDISEGLRSYRLWMFLGWQDIRQRYRRSVLGPFWLTISTGIMVGMMTLLYGRLFKLPMEVYAPFLASGTIIWALIASLMNEGCTSFMAADSLIKQVRLPLTLHVCRVLWRNLIVFLHNAVILIPVWFFFERTISVHGWLLASAALAVIILNGLWVGTLLAALCTRFRDIGQIISNLVQVVFFVTPIMWLPSILEGKGIVWWLLVVNPFYHFIEIARAPMLGQAAPLLSWAVVGGVTLIGMLLGMAMLGRFKHRIAYWL